MTINKARRALCLQYATMPVHPYGSSKADRRAPVEAKITALYADQGLRAPFFKWDYSPCTFYETSGLVTLGSTFPFIKFLAGRDLHTLFFTKKMDIALLQDIHDVLCRRTLSSSSHQSLFASTAMALSDHPSRDIYLDLSKEVLAWHPFERVCYITEKFRSISLDGRGRLHNTTGPALMLGESSFYAVNGTIISKRYLAACNRDVLLDLIRANRDDQMLLIDIHGRERFVSFYGRITEIDRFGTMWDVRMPRIGSFEIPTAVFLQVANRTPNKNGGYDNTFLRVPREFLFDPKGAVAWTFGMTSAEYRNNLLAES